MLAQTLPVLGRCGTDVFSNRKQFFETQLIQNNLELLILWWRAAGKKPRMDVTITEDSLVLTGKREYCGTLNVSPEIRKGEKHQTLRFIKILFLPC